MIIAIARPLRPVVTVVAILGLFLSFSPARAGAAPADDEGGTPSLREALDTSLRDFNDAKGRLEVSTVRQANLTAAVTDTEARLAVLTEEVATVAAAAYRGGRLDMVGAVLNSGSPEGLLHAAATVRYLTAREDRQLRELLTAQQRLVEQQAAVESEIVLQRNQLAIMDQRKKDAETALARAGGGQLTAGVTVGKVTAKPAPRNADGSWPSEKCSIGDPTTDGCVTARTQHAYEEARLAGFTRYTSCHRDGGSGEHPKGRACDFSSSVDTFEDARASGTDKIYGDRLAGWLIANASRLGVLYVIWYKQIWHPGRGWSSYSGDGTPAGDHYNHVHLSMQ